MKTLRSLDTRHTHMTFLLTVMYSKNCVIRLKQHVLYNVHAVSRSVQSGYLVFSIYISMSIESTQPVLCNKCSLTRSESSQPHYFLLTLDKDGGTFLLYSMEYLQELEMCHCRYHNEHPSCLYFTIF